jgi:hypothetical protein
LTSDHNFVEIGSADGIQNNSSWLALKEQNNSMLLDGNPFKKIT